MRYVVAFLGAVLIFLFAFFLSGIALLIAFGQAGLIPFSFAGFQTTNLIGFVFAVLAAAASFQGTLRHYRKKDQKRAEKEPAEVEELERGKRGE